MELYARDRRMTLVNKVWTWGEQCIVSTGTARDMILNVILSFFLSHPTYNHIQYMRTTFKQPLEVKEEGTELTGCSHRQGSAAVCWWSWSSPPHREHSEPQSPPARSPAVGNCGSPGCLAPGDLQQSRIEPHWSLHTESQGTEGGLGALAKTVALLVMDTAINKTLS